jgi:hypothetical protein
MANVMKKRFKDELKARWITTKVGKRIMIPLYRGSKQGKKRKGQLSDEAYVPCSRRCERRVGVSLYHGDRESSVLSAVSAATSHTLG